jgi:hypothetical protein
MQIPLQYPLTDWFTGNAQIFFYCIDFGGEGVYVDNVIVTTQDRVVYLDDESFTLGNGATTQITFSEQWTPVYPELYEVHVCADIDTGDIDDTNNCLMKEVDGGGRVHNTVQDIWYKDIQPGDDDANPDDEFDVYDGDFVEDPVLDVEGCLWHAVNPPTSSATILGTVDILGDGITFEYFHVIPGGPYTADEAAIFVNANDVLVQECLIEDMTGEVSTDMFTIKGIHVYADAQNPKGRVTLHNNTIRNIVNENLTCNGGGGGEAAPTYYVHSSQVATLMMETCSM